MAEQVSFELEEKMIEYENSYDLPEMAIWRLYIEFQRRTTHISKSSKVYPFLMDSHQRWISTINGYLSVNG